MPLSGYFYNYSQMQQLPYNNGSENGSLSGGNERSSQNWRTNLQTDKLVELWKENIVLIESSRSHETWLKIRAEINKLRKGKTVIQCRNKICNLKDIYKNAKENNAQTGISPTFPQYFHDFDEVLGCRAVVNMQETIEVGQVCRSADVPVFTSSDTKHCQKSKEDGSFCSKPSGK